MSESVNTPSSNFDFINVAVSATNVANTSSDVYSTRCAEIQTRAKNAESNIKAGN